MLTFCAMCPRYFMTLPLSWFNTNWYNNGPRFNSPLLNISHVRIPTDNWHALFIPGFRVCTRMFVTSRMGNIFSPTRNVWATKHTPEHSKTQQVLTCLKIVAPIKVYTCMCVEICLRLATCQKLCILIKMSLKIVPTVSIYNNPALV